MPDPHPAVSGCSYISAGRHIAAPSPASGILLCIIVSRYIWKSITGPLTKLVAYIKDTSELKFDTDFSDNSRDELGFMAQSYNIS